MPYVRMFLAVASLSLVIGCVEKDSPLNSDSAAVIAARYHLTPRVDSAGHVYIPADVPSALEELDQMLTSEFKREFGADSMNIIQHHFGLGLWMRNSWGLWSDSQLGQHFARRGVDHPDDMSALLLQAYWARLNGKPFRMDEAIEQLSSRGN